jgi:hypothetical protein
MIKAIRSALKVTKYSKVQASRPSSSLCNNLTSIDSLQNSITYVYFSNPMIGGTVPPASKN